MPILEKGQNDIYSADPPLSWVIYLHSDCLLDKQNLNFFFLVHIASFKTIQKIHFTPKYGQAIQ